MSFTAKRPARLQGSSLCALLLLLLCSGPFKWLSPLRSRSILLSVVHVGGQSRPLHTPRGWTPAYSSDEEAEVETAAQDNEEFVEVAIEEEQEAPETPPPRLIPKEPGYPPPGYKAKAKARLSPTPKIAPVTSSTGSASSTDWPKPTAAPEVSSSSTQVAPSKAPPVVRAPPGIRAPPPKPTARTTRRAPSNIPPQNLRCPQRPRLLRRLRLQ